MKAILVFDVDEHTYEAMIDEYFTGDITLHLGCEGCIDFKDVELKPMLQKKEIDVKKIEDIMHIEFQFTDVIRDKYIADIKLESDKLIALGYNRCIDEILGGNE